MIERAGYCLQLQQWLLSIVVLLLLLVLAVSVQGQQRHPSWITTATRRTTSSTTTTTKSIKNSNTTRKNVRFDPNMDNPWNCSIPSYQIPAMNYSPPDPKVHCNHIADGMDQQQSVAYERRIPLPTGTTLDQLAMAYAPVLFFHPMESYTMETVQALFANRTQGSIRYKNLYTIYDQIDPIKMLNTTRDPILGLDKEHYSIQQNELTPLYIGGAGYDLLTGLSRAPIYYNAIIHPITGVWILNYYLYFTYHGPTSFAILTSTKNQTNFYPFTLRPFDEHEGDWQSLSVMICPSITSIELLMNNTSSSNSWLEELPIPLAISYQQGPNGKWREHTDCTIGQCTLYQNTIHPVAFVAKSTHSLYPKSSAYSIYNSFTIDFFLNFQGFYSMDHTNFKIMGQGKGGGAGAGYSTNNQTQAPYRYFYPNETNVIHIQKPSEIVFPPPPNSSITTTTTTSSLIIDSYWQGFAGRFGGKEIYLLPIDWDIPLPERFRPPFPTCQDPWANGTRDCPTIQQDVVFFLVMQMLNVIESKVDAILDMAINLYREMLLFFIETGVAPRGPATLPQFTRWMVPINTPIQNQLGANGPSSDQFCKDLQSFVDPSKISTSFERVNVWSNVIGLTVLGCVVVVVNVAMMIHPRLFPIRDPPLYVDEQGKVEPPQWRNIFGPAILYMVCYLVTLVGLVLYFVGFAKLLSLLEGTIGIDVSGIKALSELFGLAVLFIDTSLAVVIWFPSQTMWLQTKAKYYELIGDEQQMEYYQKKCCSNGRGALAIFQVLYGAIFNGYILGILCVLIGCVNVGMAFVIGDLCSVVVGSVTGLCLDLANVGIQVRCPDFTKFCGEWAGQSSLVTLWGSLIVAAGHFYLMSAAGGADMSFRSTPYALALLQPPTNLLRPSVLQTPSKEMQITVEETDPCTNETDHVAH